MGIIKRAGIATELQYDYGFSPSAATSAGKASKVLPKQWNKCETAAYIAISSVASEGGMQGDEDYMNYCKKMVQSKLVDRKIRPEFYKHTQEMLKELSDQWGWS